MKTHMKAALAGLLLATALVAQKADTGRVLAALSDQTLARYASSLKTDERIALYEAMVKTKPGEPHYRNLLASAFLQKRRETNDPAYLERAARLVEQVLSAGGAEYEARRLRNEVELERHNFRKVAEDSRRLTGIAPDDAWNWGTLGDALMEMGDYDQAAEAYQKMVSLKPDLASYNRAAWFRFVSGDRAGAIEIMKRAASAGGGTPENLAWCLVELGNYYFKGGQLSGAEDAYAAALKAFGNYPPALAGMGRLRAARGDGQAAIAFYRKALAATPLPEYAGALYDLHFVYGNDAEARKLSEFIDVVYHMNKSVQPGDRTLALIYADQDRHLDRALVLAEKELESRRDVYTYDALAWALYKNKRYPDAEQAMSKAMKMGTQEPLFFYHAGMIAYACGKKQDAAKLLKRALELNPKFDPRQAKVAESVLADVRQ